MKQLFLLKDVAYGAKVGGGTVANMGEAGQLQPGALGIFAPNGTLLTASNAAAQMADTKEVIMAVGLTNDGTGVDPIQQAVINRRSITNFNRVNYRAPVKPVYTMQVRTLTANAASTLSVRVQDTSFTSRNLTASKAASFYKTATASIENAVDGLVANLNKDNILFTAAKTGSDPNFNITFTPKQYDVTLDVTPQEILENSVVTATTALVVGSGTATEMREVEKDYSIERGSGNYIDYTNDWYSAPSEVLAGGTYHQLTMLWTGMHESPSSTKPVMHNRLTIGILSTASSGAANQNVGAIQAILQLIIPNAYIVATSSETVADDGTDLDGTSGN